MGPWNIDASAGRITALEFCGTRKVVGLSDVGWRLLSELASIGFGDV